MLTPILQAQYEPELKRVLLTYKIKPYFRISLENSGAFFPGELARTEFKTSDLRHIDDVIIHYNQILYKEVLHYEIGHIKLRCMGLPIFYISPMMQPFEVYYLVLHGELYDWILTDQWLPNSADELMQEQIRKIPSHSILINALQNIPPEGTVRWHEGIQSLIRMVLD